MRLVDGETRSPNATPSPTAGPRQRSPATSVFAVTRTERRTATQARTRTAERSPVAPPTALVGVPATTPWVEVPVTAGQSEVSGSSRATRPEQNQSRPTTNSEGWKHGRRSGWSRRGRCRRRPDTGPRTTAGSKRSAIRRCPVVPGSSARRQRTRRREVLDSKQAQTPFDDHWRSVGAGACPVPTTATDPASAHPASVSSSIASPGRCQSEQLAGGLNSQATASGSWVPGARSSRRRWGAPNSPVSAQASHRSRGGQVRSGPWFAGGRLACWRADRSGQTHRRASVPGARSHRRGRGVALTSAWRRRASGWILDQYPGVVPATACSPGALICPQSGCPHLPGADSSPRARYS